MQKGYTILELVVVIGIIAILLTFSIPAITSFLSPKELAVVMQQVESDLRALHNKAANGVAALRLIDTNGDGVLASPDMMQNVRVSWVARFQNNAREYTMASCQYNEIVSVYGTKSENWNECQQKETKRLQYNVVVHPCLITTPTSSCSAGAGGDYVIYFKPIYGHVEIFAGSFLDSSPPSSAQALAGQLHLVFTSPNNVNTEYTLIVHRDGTISQSCVSHNIQVKCE